MAFDKPTRNRLASFVTEARNLIADEFTEQFQSLYGISRSGALTPTDQLGHLDDSGLAIAELLRERIDYLVKAHPDDTDGTGAAVARLAREQAFTVLNRLAAVRMAEKRGIIVESVGQGYQSKGFKVYETVTGAALGDTYHRYRRYLYCLFDELAVDLGGLFDRQSPCGLLFPRESALLALIAILNAPDLEALWAEDETIGWIYQYYNDPAERKKMRESAAPRNSRELAVRNQFFTPRYVVEFLTDNTLGRIWYEMTQGQTRLKDQCRYLVRRPTEVFLEPGETAPASPVQDGLSQEELLRQPVYTPHRPLKDPRELRMLDPACGSMHFGLYAFDLYEVIYEEAWDMGMESLRRDFQDKAALLREIPRLIIENNIHGIDIDPRAIQIAGLSLWLRAQRSWQRQDLKASARPRIRRSNIVCAEPMPGDEAILEEFIDGQLSASPEDRVIAGLVRRVFDAMKLAGEAGSLLKIEEEIVGAVAEAKQKWRASPESGQRRLFTDAFVRPVQQDFGLAITDEGFWDRSEELIYAALQAYAEHADQDGGYQRRLFADDAARGFAFIDLCRKRYDVVLMNPPFGEPSVGSRGYLYKRFESSKKDVFAAFVDRAMEIADSVGVISSRTGFFLAGFQTWRRNLTHGTKTIITFADLGDGVLDAMVEAAAYCIWAKEYQGSAFFRLTETHEKAQGLLLACESWAVGKRTESSFLVELQTFEVVPTSPFAYWLSREEAELFLKLQDLETQWADVIRGPEVTDLFRAARGWWEVDSKSIGEAKRWIWYAKGGEFKRFASDVHLVVDYQGSLTGSCPFRRPGDEKWYFQSGITFSQRTTKPISFRILPAGCLTSPKGPAILPRINPARLALLGLLNTRLFGALVNSRVGAAGAAARSYDLDILRRIPVPVPDVKLVEAISVQTGEALLASRQQDRADELSPSFVVNQAFAGTRSLRESYNVAASKVSDSNAVYHRSRATIERVVLDACGISDVGDTASLGDSVPADSSPREIAEDISSYLLGCAFGRWEIRFLTGEKEVPELPEPFGPLPVCPPGQLTSEHGLPVTKQDVERLKKEGGWGYPIAIPWDGILVDDPGHSLDLEARVHQVMQVIWKDRWEAIEQEACELLGVGTLRDYFRKTPGFFAVHLKRYLKSRRQAPIYWPLSTKSGLYTLWLYYHRLNDQTLHTAVADFLDPKIKAVRTERSTLREVDNQRTRLEDLQELEGDLTDLRAEIERVIKLPWKPNLNDGVLITASPLWRLFRLPKWQKDLQACWEALKKGDYDWAHLAYSIWPGRVEEACRTDRSIAIAHGLEHLCEVQPPKPKTKRGKKKTTDPFEEYES